MSEFVFEYPFEVSYPFIRVWRPYDGEVHPAGPDDYPVVSGYGVARIHLYDELREGDHPAFGDMLRAMIKHRMPDGWASDVVFLDRRELRGQDPRREFIWAIRESGSWLYWIDSENRELLDMILSSAKVVYRWDGGKLRRFRSLHVLYMVAGFSVPRSMQGVTL